MRCFLEAVFIFYQKTERVVVVVGGDTPSYCAVFGLKTRIHFAHFGLESGMIFEGTTGVYERIYYE